MVLSLLVAGIAIGLVLGVTGAGGGILAVPALVFSLRWSVAQAAPVALLAVTGSALVGAVEGLLRGVVCYRAAVLVALVGSAFTPMGVRLAHVLPARALTIVFALTMLVVAARLLHRSSVSDNPDAPCHVNPDTGRLGWDIKTALIMAMIGAFTGFLTGLLGVGGGFVIVPALRKTTDLPLHGIVATSLLVITLVGLSGITAAWLQGALAPLAAAAPFVLSTVAGMVGGRVLTRRLHTRHIQRSFAMLVIMVALALAGHALA